MTDQHSSCRGRSLSASPADPSACSSARLHRQPTSGVWPRRWSPPATPSRCPACRVTAPTSRDMLRTSWADWSARPNRALVDLESRTDEVVVAGLVMGGLAHRLALPPVTLSCRGSSASTRPSSPSPTCSPRWRPWSMPGRPSWTASAPTWLHPMSSSRPTTRSPRPAPVDVRGGRGDRRRSGSHRVPAAAVHQPAGPSCRPPTATFWAAPVSGPVERVSCDRSYPPPPPTWTELIFERSVEFVGCATA